MLTGSLSPADYLAAREGPHPKDARERARPGFCDAYANGDADGDLVPDDRDKCPGSKNLERTDADGCPDHRSLLPPAPSNEAVEECRQGARHSREQSLRGRALPERAGVIKAGVSPDGQSYLLAVASTTNQPAGCEVFYQVDIRMKNKSFFLGLDTDRV